ncbi:hypothetical protein GUG71_10150 [Xanthomonas citri pv. citri]|nr:hypothetical protein [Xanthomonas citri pv. citri]
MSDVLAWLSQFGGWFTFSALVAVLAWFTGNGRERRKLSRAERASAYANFLDACSRRWKAFGDRDRAADDSEAWFRANEEVKRLRDDAYGAYTLIQILGSQKAVRAALRLVRAYDLRNKSYWDRTGKTPGVGDDEKARLLAEFVAAARKDLKLRAIDIRLLRADAT